MYRQTECGKPRHWTCCEERPRHRCEPCCGRSGKREKGYCECWPAIRRWLEERCECPRYQERAPESHEDDYEDEA